MVFLSLIFFLLIFFILRLKKTDEVSKDSVQKINDLATAVKQMSDTSDEVKRELYSYKGFFDGISRSNLQLNQSVDNRLSEIRGTVSERLESVFGKLGEIQTLSKGLNSLERVLTNVKSRGVWGELQAERILSDILTSEQYERNVNIKGKERFGNSVEFAVKLPGKDNNNILMPIDSKFPREDYERLCIAQEKGDIEQIKQFKTALERRIKEEAKSISLNYISVPYTTDFAVMFLPVEGLYVEILSIPGLQYAVQRDYRILIAGPSTLSALLNSLQMGFRTLAIEKKSEEVWIVLGQIKNEFEKFTEAIESVQKKISSAEKEIDNLVTRNRVLYKKLSKVEQEDVND